ncbi:MAG: 2-C-methyl-D-erythritol 4-phosphate cytidylyltransferase [Enterobacterales bacterium]|nr:2-C-methyl-D-erythritol 4-phosphate cytidylyltransferase [Enterobacterales bacterium]
MPSKTSDLAFVALIPAAGIGARMGSDVPKQYLDCAGKPLICHSLELFQEITWVSKIVVTLAANDIWWPELCADKYSKCHIAPGGDSRAESVRNGLKAIAEDTCAEDKEIWVLVHDAARPCLSEADLVNLKKAILEQKSRQKYGVILADKIHDTVKKVNSEGRIVSTEDRQYLWRAQTPQVFELQALLTALDSVALESITDEASAMEQWGFQPQIIQGDATNIKVTTAKDLTLAELYLSQREN